MEKIKNLLFPQAYMCLFCKEEIFSKESHLCQACRDRLEIIHREVDLNLAHVEKIYYSTLYNRFIREKMHAFKFQGKSYLYKAFGQILMETMEELDLARQVDLLAFLPSHKRKEALRGYNQAYLLASYLSKATGLPLLKKHIKKTKQTKDQNKLSGWDRQKNLKGCFKAMGAKDFKDKEILLIDDIVTTGASMEEVSKTLIVKGAGRVYGLALTSSMKL